MEKIRLLLADDHLDVLNSLATRFKGEPGFEIIGQATNSSQAVALTLAVHPDIVIIDPVMRDGSGFAALQQIIRRCPRAAIVVLTAFVDTAMGIELKKLGISLIFSKGTETSELIATLFTLYHRAL